MEKLCILDECDVFTNCNFEDLKNKIIEPNSIIYFCENISNDDEILKLSEIENVENLNVFCKFFNCEKSKKVSRIRNLKKLKCSCENVIFILNINDNYEYLKFAIRNMHNVVKMCKTLNKKIQFVEISNNSSKYYEDVKKSIKAMFIEDEYKRYGYIYDEICNTLDIEFSKNQCEFKDDMCLGNRCKNAAHRKMGCCYSFEYTNFFNLKGIKNIKQCAFMKDSHCTAKNISCKLFTCKELKKKGVDFNQHDYLLLECFFDKKQHDVIASSFFVTREDILQKLIEVGKNNEAYFMYFLFYGYRIDTRY